MKTGDSASFSKTITESDINQYAELTGDFNALHISEEAAANGIFGRRVAHGMLAAGLISTVLGTGLPGDGAVYLSQSLNFVKPVMIGDTITAVCTVTEVLHDEKGIYRLETKCVNQNGENVITGEAVIKYTGEYVKKPAAKQQEKKTDSFYSEEELKGLGIKKYGENVLISRNAVLYDPELLEIGNHLQATLL